MTVDIPAIRLERLRSLVRQKGILSLHEAREELGVSEVTLRRDFAALDRAGEVERTRGGIIAADRVAADLPYVGRESRDWEAKRAIGQCAAQLVRDGDTIFVSGGTTCLALAHALTGRRDLTVITTSVSALTVLMPQPGIQVIATGGVASAHNRDLTGSDAEESIKRYRASKAFVGASGVSAEGIFNASLPRAATDRAMVHSSITSFVLADHTKIGLTALSLVAPLGRFQTVVTDAPPSAELCDSLWTAGVRVLTPGGEVHGDD